MKENNLINCAKITGGYGGGSKGGYGGGSKGGYGGGSSYGGGNSYGSNSNEYGGGYQSSGVKTFCAIQSKSII
jgi:hypothetical protein